jgi:hypothetical protein
MTGQPPEAPDHQTLTPADLQRLHRFCADQMKRRAANMEDLAFCATFKRGDVVLVHQVAKRSHKDARGVGPMSYPARAVVMKQSATNQSHYQIKWLTDGLYAKEKTGDVSKKFWIAWKLKLCKAGLGPHVGQKAKAIEAKIVADVLSGKPETVSPAEEDKEAADEEPPISDRDAIEVIAERCVNTS